MTDRHGLVSAERSESWRHQLSASFAGLRCEALPEREPVGTIRATPLGDVGVYAITGTPQHVRRTARVVRSEPLELLKVCLMTSGEAVISQAGRTVSIRPGAFAVYDTSRPYQLTLSPRWSCRVMTVPRAALGLTDGVLTRAMEHAHEASGAGQLLASLLRGCDDLNGGSPAAVTRVGSAAVALLAGALAGRGPSTGDVEEDLLRHQVIAWIRAHLHEPGLSTERIAAAHHMAQRTLQRLFEQEDRGVAGYVRDLRLDAVRQDLADPTLAHHTITAIAARWSVTDSAWLARSFKARYGMTPTAYRRQARAAHVPGDT